MWGRGGEGYGIIGLPFSPTLTAAALVQHRPTERGKAGAKLALKASPAPPSSLVCFPHPFTPSRPLFDLSGHVSFVLTGTGQAKGGGREPERDTENDPSPVASSSPVFKP